MHGFFFRDRNKFESLSPPSEKINTGHHAQISFSGHTDLQKGHPLVLTGAKKEILRGPSAPALVKKLEFSSEASEISVNGEF